eukprot:5277002-Amphidinium_carterae.1
MAMTKPTTTMQSTRGMHSVHTKCTLPSATTEVSAHYSLTILGTCVMVVEGDSSGCKIMLERKLLIKKTLRDLLYGVILRPTEQALKTGKPSV